MRPKKLTYMRLSSAAMIPSSAAPGSRARARPRQQACPRQKAAAEAIPDTVDGRVEPRVARCVPGEQIPLPRRPEVGDPDPEQSQRRIGMRGTPLAQQAPRHRGHGGGILSRRLQYALPRVGLEIGAPDLERDPTGGELV